VVPAGANRSNTKVVTLTNLTTGEVKEFATKTAACKFMGGGRSNMCVLPSLCDQHLHVLKLRGKVFKSPAYCWLDSGMRVIQQHTSWRESITSSVP
jgi:hypothetical protein